MTAHITLTVFTFFRLSLPLPLKYPYHSPLFLCVCPSFFTPLSCILHVSPFPSSPPFPCPAIPSVSPTAPLNHPWFLSICPSLSEMTFSLYQSVTVLGICRTLMGSACLCLCLIFHCLSYYLPHSLVNFTHLQQFSAASSHTHQSTYPAIYTCVHTHTQMNKYLKFR